jgi:hypothetical protein
MRLSVLLSICRNNNRVPGKILIQLLLFLLASSNIFCQEDESALKSNILSFSPGSNRIKENILIPKINRGSLISISYRYENESRNYNEFSFILGYSKLKTRLETEKVTQNEQLSFGYSWGKSLIFQEKVKYYLGFNAGYDWTLMEYPVWDESRAYWGTSLTAGPFNRLKVNLNNQCSWISSFCLGLLGILSRPDDVRLYAQEEWKLSNIMQITNSNFFFGVMNNILICNFKNEYRIPLKDDNFLSVYGSVFYETISKSEGQSLQISQITAGIGLGF